MITLSWYSDLTAEELAAASARLTIEEDSGRRRVSLTVDADDSSYRYRALMEKPQLVLKFSLPEYIDFPVGTWCVWQNETYTLNSEKNLTKDGERKITYEMTLGGDEDKLGVYKMRNSVDGRLSYSMCAKPHEFAEEIVKNLNARETEDGVIWEVGDCLEAAEQTVEFNHAYIDDALQSVADQFETEWEITDHKVCLHKVEYFKDSPLPLSYGRGNGFTPGLGRTTDTDEAPIKRVYTQGGEQNIDRSKYGGQTADGKWANAFHYKTSSAQLRLPISQTLEYEGRTYKTDEDGYYVERADKVSDAVKEDSLDCSEIYPKRVGSVSAVETGSEASAESNHFYDIIDKDIPASLDYNKVIIDGETPTVAFQSGMLAGKEFEFTYKHSERRFKLVPQEIDGITMPDPDSGYFPKEGDEYIVLGVMLPDAYVCDDATQSGAAWDMFREAARKLYENEEQKFTFKGELQGLWCKRNWLRVGGHLKVGAYIRFTDTQFAKDGVDIRITGIKDYLYSPYSPTVEISNSVSGKSVTSSLREIEQTEVAIKDTKTELVQYTKRRFRDAKETITMLEEAMLGDYTATVSPVAVLTMAMLVGDESLQFEWVESKANPVATSKRPYYNSERKRMEITALGLKHLTLGVTSISSKPSDDCKVWQMREWQSPTLTEATARYYLYAEVSRDTSEKGSYFLSEKAVGMNDTAGKYTLLVGILNSESGGERSFTEMHGYTEILPGRITTERIVSEDGKNWLDLKNNQFVLGDAFRFTGGQGGDSLVVNGEVNATSGTFKNGTFTDVKVLGTFRGTFKLLTDENFDTTDNFAMATYAASMWQPDTEDPNTYNYDFKTKDTANIGRVVRFVNGHWGGAVTYGTAKITLSDGAYFYENGVRKTQLKLSNGIVELVGYGDESEFLGWIVTHRTDFLTANAYGAPSKQLLMARVTVTQNSDNTYSVAMNCHTFDGETAAVERKSIGQYRLTLPKAWNFADAGDIFVTTTGYGHEADDPNFGDPMRATVLAVDCDKDTGRYYIDIMTSGDDRNRDGSFQVTVQNCKDMDWQH